ncbi:AAA family ATPase [Iocasia frigidifontis]|uniref:Shikimate kinase n=1 Tax=Iocasia fonsfrigidae TaxID=2682810 RepID=A0A8A7KBC6_9FIRM|nr:shikimate kinase [Iocasia fonsfrigidae]QTL98540.1 AAA family ATPase [Iocasia fonsfrigidae]
MKISLVGFMATGKSKVGSLLANDLGYQFFDTDELIERKTGLSIPEIFQRKGEEYFRRVETESLADILEKDKIVISTGGGIVVSRFNRELLLSRTISFLLTASAEEIYQRVKGDNKRPLLSVSDPLNEIRNLLSRRAEYYNAFTNKIDTMGKKPEVVVKKILDLIGEINDE